MTELMDKIKKRRTFAIISHPDAGKTTLTEKLLLYGGAIHLAGSVKARKSNKHAVSDWMEIEKQRGISVTSSVLQFDYDGFRATVDGREIAVERGGNNRVSVVLPAGTSGALKIWFAGKGWWRVGDAVSAATLIGLLFWMKKGEKKACRTH